MANKPTPGNAGGVSDFQLPGPEGMDVIKNLVAGKPWIAVTNVTQPTMAVFSPKGTNTGVAMVAFPAPISPLWFIRAT
jgi:hypothetical protein